MGKIIDLAAHHGAFVSITELAEYWNVSTRTIYRDIEKGCLLVYRLPGGTIRIAVDDARRYGKPEE